MARVVGYGGDVFVGINLHNCDALWNESVDADVTASLDDTDYRTGSGSNKFVQAAPLANGDILATDDGVFGDLSAYSVGFCWAKSSVNINTADDYRILLDNHANCASPDCQLSLPVLVADVWKFCQLPVVAGSFAAVSAGISVGLKLQANDPGAATMWIDSILTGRSVAGIRAWSIDYVANIQDTTSFQDGQAKVFSVLQTEWSGSFEGFKDGAPLAIGSIYGIELRESSTATQQWRGTILITNARPVSSVDGMVTYAYDFQGIHELEVPTA